jgi:hypothetical protein
MATIKLKRGTSTPTTSNIVDGEVALDLSAKKLYVNDGGTIKEIGAGALTASQLNDINVVAGQVAHGTDLGSVADSLSSASGATNITTVADDITNVNTVAGSIGNVNTVAGSISNVNTTAGSISNVNTVSSSISDVNRYANEYVIQSGQPSSPSAGDLWYNTTANVLNYYTGGSWVGITGSGIASLAADSSPELSAALDCNNNNLTEVGTVSGNNLQIDFGTL